MTNFVRTPPPCRVTNGSYIATDIIIKEYAELTGPGHALYSNIMSAPFTLLNKNRPVAKPDPRLWGLRGD